MQRPPMNQPFNKKQIRYFFLFYGGVIALVLLFYIVTTLVHTPVRHEHRDFPTERNASEKPLPPAAASRTEKKESPIKLLPAR
jgi:hypothetical protein